MDTNNVPAQPSMNKPMPAMKPSGKDRFRSVMPIAVMAFALAAFLVLVWVAVS